MPVNVGSKQREKIRGITNNLLTFQNVLYLLPLRLAQGSRKCSIQDPGPPSHSHPFPEGSVWILITQVLAIILDMYLDELLLYVVIH